MVQDWPELMKAVTADVRQLRAGAPDVMKAFGAMAMAAGAAKRSTPKPRS